MSEFKKQLDFWCNKNAFFITPIPEIKEISYLDKPVFETVYLKSDPLAEDIYLPNPKQLDNCRLTASAKKKLARAAGVVWNLEQTGIVEQKSDLVTYNAVGGVKKPDGQFVYISSVYSIDLNVLKEKFEAQYVVTDETYHRWENKKWNKGKSRKIFEMEQKNNKERDLRQKRAFMPQLAETGAKVRAITELLGLKNSYTRKELTFPFVAVRIVFNQNNQDPLVKKALLETRLAAEFSLYGINKNPAKQIPVIKNELLVEDIEEAEFKEEPQNSKEIDFLNCDTETQFDCLEKLAKEKNYDFEKYIKGLSNGYAGLSDQRRIDFLNHLKSL
jgi:hypothetical protein